ncbi:MAG: peptidylprolyl isomerase [Bacteroidota bacterium]
MNRIVPGLLIVCFLFSCNSSEKEPINKFSDPVILKIADFQDHRNSDSLLIYLNHANPVYRREALTAFGSVQDSSVVENIGRRLLMDSDTLVRRAAAFALGQIPTFHSERLLLGGLVKEKNNAVFCEIVEAYGKVTEHWQLVQPTLLRDTAKTCGFGWSLYRSGLRNTADSTVNRAVADLLAPANNVQTRLSAAHFFARGARQYESAERSLIDAAKNDPSVEVRMAAVLALRKIKTDNSLLAIREVLEKDSDYRVQISAVRALAPFPFEKTKADLFSVLNHKNTNVGIASSEVIIASATKDYWLDIANIVDRVKNWRIQANLYEAVLKVSDNKEVAEEVFASYRQTTNSYHKAALLSALQNSVIAAGFIEEELFKADTLVVKSTAAAALVSINRGQKFKSALRAHFADIYKKAIETGDAAVIGTVSAALADSVLGYRNVIKDFSFLYDAKKKLSLPRDNESLQPLEMAIAHFERRKVSAIKNEFNHPIDWDLIKTLPRDQKAVIITSRGSITLRLLVEEAPGSVANFIHLANMNYFDHKLFHRVVPNFVAQAGCKRGDGFGSEDYSIRSEFSWRKYKTGSVGMASAGKDTEGTQWFITHSPTPHLDGRYTIFAEVEEGMDVVHLIEVGDEIVDVKLVGKK